MRRGVIVVAAWTPLALTGVTIAAAAAVVGLTGSIPDPVAVFLSGIVLLAAAFVAIGGLVSSRLPEHPIGWILSGIGLGQTLNAITLVWWGFARSRVPPLGDDLALWAGSWTWIPSVGLLVTFLLLLFPTGRPPTPRWRPVGWIAASGIAIATGGVAVHGWGLRHLATLDSEVPFGVVGGVGFGMILIASIASIASLIVRFRRADGEERQQLRWFVAAGALTIVGLFLSFIPLQWSTFFIVPGFLALSAATGIAILRYRLYDLEIVVRKTVVFTVVTATLTGLYLAVLALATVGRVPRILVGLLLIVITYRPVRDAARSLAGRLVYGKRASAYEVLTTFAGRLAETYSNDDVLPRMARVLTSGTGASSTRVLLRVGGELREVASAGELNRSEELVVPVVHQSEDLGALAVTMPANDPMNPSKDRLIRDLASQAGLVLRNVRLIEELRASRQRLVAAQDEERRKLERNLHDGAQQQLVALQVKQRLAEQLAERDPSQARELLAQLQLDTSAALEELRDLARGIYPPLLADRGLPAALEAQARKSPVPVEIDPNSVGRYAQEVESAVYFCVLEALNNVAKYARATSTRVRLAVDEGELRFEVADDGVGFDPDSTGYGTGLQGMADRLDAIGGTLRVTSAPERGTKVTGSVPVGTAK